MRLPRLSQNKIIKGRRKSQSFEEVYGNTYGEKSVCDVELFLRTSLNSEVTYTMLCG